MNPAIGDVKEAHGMRSRCSKLIPLFAADSEMTRCCTNLMPRQHARLVVVTRFQIQVLSFSPVASEPESPTWCVLKEGGQ